MLDDPDAGVADGVFGARLVALGVEEMPGVKAKDGGVSQELVEIGVGVAGRLLGLVLGIGDAQRQA